MTNERRLKRTNMPNVNNDYKELIRFQISGLLMHQYKDVYAYVCVCVYATSRHSLSSSVFCLQNINLKTTATRLDVPFRIQINDTLI